MAVVILKEINEFLASLTKMEHFSTCFFIAGIFFLYTNKKLFKNIEDGWGEDSLFDRYMVKEVVDISVPDENGVFRNQLLYYGSVHPQFFYTEADIIRLRILEINLTILAIAAIILNFKSFYIGYDIVEPFFFPTYDDFYE